MLGLLGEGAVHGFALAAALAPGGELGRVWTVPRPIVYQAIRRLRDGGLVVPLATQPSQAGPTRTILTLTPAGRARLESWLEQPVAHVRDVRSLLLLKLALLDRRGRSLRPLAVRQLEVLEPALAGLATEADHADGFDALVARWRLASYRAAADFLRPIATPAARRSRK